MFGAVVVELKAFEKKLKSRTVRGIVRCCALAICAAVSTGSGWAAELRFVPLVQFKLGSAFAGGGVGSLRTDATGNEIIMRLSNVAAVGADKAQELITRVSKSDLSLTSSVIYDVVKDAKIREMRRKTGTSILDNKKTDVFEYTELKDGRVTTTEPYIEYKVADFLSVMLLAADAIQRNATKPIDLSMLRDRSVTRVILRIGAQVTVGGKPGTEVRVAPPDNPSGGVGYVIARTDDGSYYPARITVQSRAGLVQLEGMPQ